MAINSTIKPGYKQTELGLIPDDWDIASLGKLCSYQNGTALESYFNDRDGLSVISIGNYSESGKFVETGSYIGREYLRKLNKFVLDKNDLTMILNDKTAVGTIIGRVLYIDNDEKYIFNQRTMRLTTKEKIDSLFLYFQINSAKTHKFIVNLSKPGTQIYVNTNDITDLPIIYPKSKSEQAAIATVLSDTDALIENLEKLIDKKKAIKQGTMQQLLTGKKRLPGFSGEWEEKQLIEIANFYDNLRIPIAESKREDGTTPYYGANGIQGYINGHTHDGEFVFIAEDGANDLNNYPVSYVNGKVWVNNHAHVIQGINNKAKTKYLSYALKTINFVQVLVGGTRAKLNGSVAKAIRIKIPVDITEQAAIAAVLSDMDSEIEGLEKKRDKYAMIKQGMMQQLLTGKIRLYAN